MKVSNRKKSESTNPKVSLFKMIIGMMMLRGKDEATSEKKAAHLAFAEGGNPEFYPKKHTVMSYAKQNRLAKKRKNK